MEILKNFIVLEGIDGSGTTTQIKRLTERNPQKILATAEPTGLCTGKFLRQLLRGDFFVTEKTAAFLFAADRAEHIYGSGGILESLKDGKIVVSDRYLFSSLAYQAVSCGSGLPSLLNSSFPLPEILFYFELDVETALARVSSRNGTREIYEKKELQEKIAANYTGIISRYEKAVPEMKIIRIDATRPISEISEQIYSVLESAAIV